MTWASHSIIADQSSGYTTAHAIKVFPRFFPSLQTANVRLMVLIPRCNLQQKLSLAN